MIQARNIDFATMTLPSIMIEQKDVGYGYTGNLSRVGNLVTFESWGAPSSAIVSGNLLDNMIPEGFRPVYNTRGARVVSDNQNTQWMTIQFLSTGQTRFYGNVQKNQAVMNFTTWMTNDPWPTN